MKPGKPKSSARICSAASPSPAALKASAWAPAWTSSSKPWPYAPAPTIRVVYGGTYEEQQKSFHDLALVLGLAIVLVFMVLLFEFRNFAAPTAILASALFSTSGVFLRCSSPAPRSTFRRSWD